MPGRTRSRVARWRRGITPEGAHALPPLVVIGGATATGKSGLAIDLARRMGAEIVSADSRQVYRGMDIGTAKVTPAQRAEIPHHGLDLVGPDEPFTAATFRRAAMEALAGIAARGRLAILVGGTGLYLRAVARGLPLDATGADAVLRAELEERHARHGLATLVDELRACDPDVATTTDLRNPRRVIRALERAAMTGSARPPTPRGYPAPVLWLGLAMPGTAHRAAIEARAREQFERGLLDEAARLREAYPEDLPAFSAMGYREAFEVLAGRTDLAAAIATDAARTWRYARRQGTWFRREPGITWLDATDDASTAASSLVDAWLVASAEPDWSSESGDMAEPRNVSSRVTGDGQSAAASRQGPMP